MIRVTRESGDIGDVGGVCAFDEDDVGDVCGSLRSAWGVCGALAGAFGDRGDRGMGELCTSDIVVRAKTDRRSVVAGKSSAAKLPGIRVSRSDTSEMASRPPWYLAKLDARDLRS